MTGLASSVSPTAPRATSQEIAAESSTPLLGLDMIQARHCISPTCTCHWSPRSTGWNGSLQSQSPGSSSS